MRSPFIRVLTYWSLFVIGLILVRFAMTQTYTHGYLLWNLLLAWAPILFIYLANYYHRLRWVFIALWFIFLPNALYLITDLKHITTDVSFTVYWLDIVLFGSLAIIGVLLGVAAVREMKKYLSINASGKVSRVVTTTAIILSGYGVYLGRFPRLNSWHVISQPLQLVQTVWNATITILTEFDSFFFVALFTIAFALFYHGYSYIDDRITS